MDLTHTTTPTKSADSENDTPPHVQPIKSLSFSNGALRRHHHHHQAPPLVVVTYKECLKNHAAGIGAHAVDGCGEFMPTNTPTPTDPDSMRCAACGCHRNFHRRDECDDHCCYPSPVPISSTTPTTAHFLDFQRPLLIPQQQSRRFSPSPSPPPPPPPPPSSYAPHTLLALSTAVPDDHHHQHLTTPVTPTALKGENSGTSRKRFRTKFTTEQKEKMLCFAERQNWKMPKNGEAGVEEFCNELGVSRGVLKVWMHNNKHTIGKKHSTNNNNDGTEDAGASSSQNNDVSNKNSSDEDTNGGGGVHPQLSNTNGSSPSS